MSSEGLESRLSPAEQETIKALDKLLFPPDHPYDYPLEEEEWLNHFKSPNSHAWVVVNDDTFTSLPSSTFPFTGVALTELKKTTNHIILYLFWIGVHPHLTRRGIGNYLLDHVIKYAKAHQFHAIELDVNVNNLIAIEWYTKIGFVQKHVNVDYYIPDSLKQTFSTTSQISHDGITMLLMLDSKD